MNWNWYTWAREELFNYSNLHIDKVNLLSSCIDSIVQYGMQEQESRVLVSLYLGQPSLKHSTNVERIAKEAAFVCIDTLAGKELVSFLAMLLLDIPLSPIGSLVFDKNNMHIRSRRILNYNGVAYDTRYCAFKNAHGSIRVDDNKRISWRRVTLPYTMHFTKILPYNVEDML